MRTTLAAVIAAVALSACATVSLPPKSGPEEVEMINPAMGQAPEDGYKVIGPVSISAPLGTTNEQLMQMMLAQAAEMGADGLILESISQPLQLDADREEGPTGVGRAIYYPASATAN